MKIKPRSMKKYTPRKKRASKDIQKQQLKDFEHLLSMDLGSLLVLLEEGTKKQAEQARAKMGSDLRKYGSDLEEVGRALGEDFPTVIRDYIKNMIQISQNTATDIDPAILNDHLKYAEKLRKLARG